MWVWTRGPCRKGIDTGMIIIGEKLNSSIPAAREAFQNRDEAFVEEVARAQCEAGAKYLDINTSVMEDEFETLLWAVRLVQKTVDCGIMVDSPDPAVIARLYGEVKLEDSVINSVTLEEQRLGGILPIVEKYKTGIVALPVSDEGIPKTAEERIINAVALIAALRDTGVPDEKIFVDILIEAAAANDKASSEALQATYALREQYPDIQLVAGLSNISFGLPRRAAINRAFLSCAMTMGLSAAILNPLDNELMMGLLATNMLLGRDEYCREYLTGYRRMFD